ncbi:MAG TPA: phosphate acyltransferase PlsX [Spirochaetia bacterium]|nr:phosphate acyltransferase PlsX [Spirochaetia bacterium]
MQIAVDAMGGDFAPREAVLGALEAVDSYNLEVILVGDEATIRAELAGYPPHPGIKVCHAPEVIAMHEQPAVAVRKKRQSSIVVSVQLVKTGQASALVSAGHTGAAMAGALLGLGRIGGVDRPAIASVLPGEKGGIVLLDAGANVDCKPYNLMQFAMMGSIYAEKIRGVANPRVGLLSVGEEDCKGNELTLATFPLLKGLDINFAGNVEGRDIFTNLVDVVVCDGFSGNIVLKMSEGLAGTLFRMLKTELKEKCAGQDLLPVIDELARRLDYAEYGGAPLLGVNGVVVISHGSSRAKAFKNAIRMAGESVDNGLVRALGAMMGKRCDEVSVDA